MATETLTSTYDTLTISASSGFVPLSSALAAQGHAVAKKLRRGSLDLVRDAEPEPDARFAVKKATNTQKVICGSDGSITVSEAKVGSRPDLRHLLTRAHQYDPPIYKGSVTCYRRVTIIATKVVSVTARSTKTITAPKGTVTSVLYPRASRFSYLTPCRRRYPPQPQHTRKLVSAPASDLSTSIRN